MANRDLSIFVARPEFTYFRNLGCLQPQPERVSGYLQQFILAVFRSNNIIHIVLDRSGSWVTAHLFSNDGNTDITFRLPDAAIPEEMETSRDNRELVVAFMALQFDLLEAESDSATR